MRIPETVKVGDTLAYVYKHGSNCRKVTVSRVTPTLVECAELTYADGSPRQFMRRTGVEKGMGDARFPEATLNGWDESYATLVVKTQQYHARALLRELDCSAVPLATLQAAITLLRAGGATR